MLKGAVLAENRRWRRFSVGHSKKCEGCSARFLRAGSSNAFHAEQGIEDGSGVRKIGEAFESENDKNQEQEPNLVNTITKARRGSGRTWHGLRILRNAAGVNSRRVVDEKRLSIRPLREKVPGNRELSPGTKS